VRDSAAILDATGFVDPLAFYQAPKNVEPFANAIDAPFRKLKIGFAISKPMGGTVHEDCVLATELVAKTCERLGHKIVDWPLNLPFTGKHLGDLFSVLWGVGTTGAMALFDRISPNGLDENLVEPMSFQMYQQAKGISGSAYEGARINMHKVARAVLNATMDVDIWLSPTLAMPPVAIGLMAQNPEDPMAPMKLGADFSPMTALFNISGQPAASLPVFSNKDGLPIGVQAVARFGDESTLLQFSSQMEREFQWERIASI
jgi:Asp-tRNA(Asn)/Glu-tRNA(Gln) amidotransferase A subunit family amidase